MSDEENTEAPTSNSLESTKTADDKSSKWRDTGFQDFMEEIQPYLKALGDVKQPSTLHRLEPEVAKKYLDITHDIALKKIELESRKLDITSKTSHAELQVADNRHARSGYFGLAFSAVFGAIILICAHWQMESVAWALATGGFSLFGVRLGQGYLAGKQNPKPAVATRALKEGEE